MSILTEIQTWAFTLPDWQQDAVGRLFSKGDLSSEDDDDLYALLKATQGIADPQERVAKKLGESQLTASQPTEAQVRLMHLGKLRHVNALAPNQTINFIENGLTVIYGDNGVGKSGYSRVLKKACRARDQNEPILPDAKLAPGLAGKAEAEFGLLVNGISQVVNWSDDQIPPTELTSIAIFDGRCARAYVDAQGDFSYVPYGFDILTGLAKLFNRLKSRLDQEQKQNIINMAAFSHLSAPTTDVGKLIAGLSAKTRQSDIESKGTLSETELALHSSLEKNLKEVDPKKKAAEVKLQAGRFSALATRCTAKGALASVEAATKLQTLVGASNVAKAAAELAAKKFKNSPGQLPGTGGDKWQLLFEAARAFSLESHPDKEFPHLGPAAQCPLCQQPLGHSAGRLEEFEKFIQNETEKTFRNKRAAAKAAYESLMKADLGIGFEPPLSLELATINDSLAKSCDAFTTNLRTRRDAIKAACHPNGNWEALGQEIETPVGQLTALANTLNQEAAALEKLADDKARAALESQFKELDARVQLTRVKGAVLDALTKLIYQQKLKTCEGALRTNGISAKSTELTEKIVSKELGTALNNEFMRLNVNDLHVSLKPFTEKGKTLYKLVLTLPGDKRPASILSEGEQRAIAIAAFLAEVNISGGRGPVVFDDPVSSLDHRRRGLVARRLCEEARLRQVIVLTHDLYFLCLIQQEAKDVGISIAPLALRRTPEGYGVCSEDLPFGGITTSKRVGVLRAMHVHCEKFHRAGDQQEAEKRVRETYFHLRLAWERAIEEVLFREVVTRFSEGVSTQRLAEVTVEDGDYVAINTGMTKSSKFAHDGASAANVPTPHPDELMLDINALDSWRKEIEGRRESVRRRRKP